MADTLASLGNAANLTPADMTYLEKKGYSSIAVIARAAKDDEEFIKRIIEPYRVGIKLDGADYKSVGDGDLVEARFLVLFEDAKNSRRTALAASAAPSSTATMAHRQPTGTSGGPVLDPKTYHDLISKWQDGWVPKRVFPHHLIQGADSVLLRILNEHTDTRFYTPLHLGEIVQSRAHNTDGSINLSRVDKPRRDDRVILTTSGVEYESASPDPLAEADRWKIFDALTANGWAMRWAGYCTDLSATSWTDWLISELRTPGNIEVFKLFYHTCNWRIAFAMRGGTKFDEETAQIMKDDEWVRKTKVQIREKLASPGATPKSSQSNQQFQPRARSRGRSRGQDNRKQYRSRSPRGPPPQKGRSKGQLAIENGPKPITGAPKSRLTRSRSRGGTALCRQFNAGRCKKRAKGARGTGAECNYSHECGGCGKNGCVGLVGCRR